MSLAGTPLRRSMMFEPTRSRVPRAVPHGVAVLVVVLFLLLLVLAPTKPQAMAHYQELENLWSATQTDPLRGGLQPPVPPVATAALQVDPAAAGPLILSREEAIARGGSNVIVFGNLFLPRTFRQASPEFHFELADILAQPSRLNAFSVFRDGAKTTLLRAYTLQRICYGLSNTVMFVSATQDHSILSLDWLANQIERNKRIQDAFGLRPGRKWNETYREIISDFHPDPIVVLAMGITGQTRGFNVDDHRPDLIIGDDLQTEENVGTDVQQEKTHGLVFASLLNSLSPASENPLAKAVFLQTPMRRGDIIDTCLRDPTFMSKVFSVFDEHGESRWEARYSTATLLADKAAHVARGQYSMWMSEKECRIVKSENKTFDVANVQFWEDLPQRNHGCVTAIDPASSEDKRASDNVILTAMRQGPDIYVAAYKAAKGQMPEQVANDFFNHVFLFGPSKLVVETVGYQKVLAKYITQQMLVRRVFRPVKEVQDRRAKSDRIIQALAGLIAHRHLFVHKSMLELLDQLDAFEPDREGRFDIIDALAMACDDLSSPFAAGTTLDLPIEEQLAAERQQYGELHFEWHAP